MSSNVITALPAFLLRRKSPEVVDILPPNAERDLEFLDTMVSQARRRKVSADGDLIKAQEAAIRAANDLSEAVDELERELRERGSLCRK